MFAWLPKIPNLFLNTPTYLLAPERSFFRSMCVGKRPTLASFAFLCCKLKNLAAF